MWARRAGGWDSRGAGSFSRDPKAGALHPVPLCGAPSHAELTVAARPGSHGTQGAATSRTAQSVGAAQAAKRGFSRAALPGRSAVPTGAGQPGRTEVSHRAPGRQGAGFIRSPASGMVAA